MNLTEYSRPHCVNELHLSLCLEKQRDEGNVLRQVVFCGSTGENEQLPDTIRGWP